MRAVPTALVVLALCSAVLALPLTKLRALQRVQQSTHVDADLLAAVDAYTGMGAPPALSGSFHTKYSIFLIKMDKPLVPSLSRWLDKGSQIMTGECWQNTNADGTVTIKTITTRVLVGHLLTPQMTQTWVKNHGWTEKKGQCTKDVTNSQLVIPGDVLTKGGTPQGQGVMFLPILPPTYTSPAPAGKGGLYKVDIWDANLGVEGSVTYYLHSGTTMPLMSHYRLKGKPPVWAQYLFFNAGPNPDSVYAPSPLCVNAAAAAANPAAANPAGAAAHNAH